MKVRFKPISIACFLTCIAGLMFTAKGFAGGNGSGNEPPTIDTTEGAGFICSIIPFACELVESQSNGSGNEPPKRG